MPFLAIGAGFVIATTVRTAIIFASVPRGLPATAAALNEASLLLGMRAGILLSTAIVGQVAVAALANDLAAAGITGAEAANRQSLFEGLLAVLGTSAFADTASAIHPGDAAGFAAAYVAGDQVRAHDGRGRRGRGRRAGVGAARRATRCTRGTTMRYTSTATSEPHRNRRAATGAA